jgi:hypothetical protein
MNDNKLCFTLTVSFDTKLECGESSEAAEFEPPALSPLIERHNDEQGETDGGKQRQSQQAVE